MKASPQRETDRLWLRAPAESDIDTLFRMQGDAEAMRFTYRAPDRRATAVFVESRAARFEIDGFAPWTAVLKAENRVVGWGGSRLFHGRSRHRPHLTGTHGPGHGQG